MTQKLDRAKLAKLDTANDMLDSKYGFHTSLCPIVDISFS